MTHLFLQDQLPRYNHDYIADNIVSHTSDYIASSPVQVAHTACPYSWLIQALVQLTYTARLSLIVEINISM